MRAVILLFLIFSFSFAQTHFTARLTGDQQNPAVTTSATGTGVFTLTDAGLEFTVTVEGLDFTNAHFHNAAVGVNGGVVRGIFDDFDGNTASGIWTSTDNQPLTDELIAELLAGNLYVNVHTAANGGGEIRGQVNLSTGTGFSARLTGDQQNPPVTTSATGTGVFTLTDAGLEYTVTVEGLDFTNAHFHNGAVGVNGGVARGIFDDFDGNTASGIWTSAEGLTDELIAELLAGNIYVNVHTAANGGGEIRGQVNLSAGTGFSARLTGDQQNPPVTTSATGTGAFTLTDAGLVFKTTVEGLDFTNAHFHNGAVGVNGGVVRAIFDDFDGNTASGIWTSAEGLTNELIAELLAGNLYVNVHTAANGGGEIRGQLNPIDIATSIERIDETSGLPTEFQLFQNFPNPFNPNTVIRFNLKNSGTAILTIYNILGQEIATLLNEDLQAGSYKVNFESTTLPSGLYVYRLDSSGQSEIRKMILLK